MTQSPSTGARGLIAVVALLHIVVAGFAIRHGALNPDEGFYAAAARAVWSGSVPYRDFGYTQPPLLPYVNGLAMQVTGFGLFAQRSVNALWTALALGLAGLLIARRSSATTAAITLLGCSLCLPWMYFSHLGKTYAFTSLLVVLAAWIWLERPPGWRKAALLGLLGVIGVGCRLTAAPFFGLLWLAALAEPGGDPRGRRALVAIAALGGAAALLLLPFWLAAPESAQFWVLDFHRVSVPVKTWHLAWQEIVTLAPALWLATGIGLVGLGLRRVTAPRAELILGLAALLTLAANLLPGGVYEEYAVPFLLPLAIPVALALHRFAAGTRAGPALVAGLAVVQFGVAPLVLWRDFPARRFTLSAWLTPNAPAFNPVLPAQLAAARDAVAAAVPAGQPLIGPNVILALETGRPVPPALLMGPFSFNTTLPADTARRLHLATPADMEAWLADPNVRALAFFLQPQLNYGWTVPTFDRLPEDVTRRWLEAYRRDFVVVFQEGNFLLLARPPAR